MTSEAIKKALLQSCDDWVNTRYRSIKKTLEEIQISLQEETKSSAGDKHETGRAMLQIDRENAGRQLAEVEKVKALLHKVDITHPSNHVSLGSLVTTSLGSYFMAVSAGILEIVDQKYYAVAPNSPIGMVLLGKEQGDTVAFNGKSIKITAIA